MATTVRTNLSASEVAAFLGDLPKILAGEIQDRGNIRRGFASRLAFTMLGLIKEDFQKLGRGQRGSDGRMWLPLTKEYLAYTRPIRGRKRPKAGKKWPGGKDGFMSARELKIWKRDYARALSWLLKKYKPEVAKPKAAAIATAKYKNQGGKVKISERAFGGRIVGIDYQTLVDTGGLRNSLTPGRLAGDDYQPKTDDQIFEVNRGEIVVGTKAEHAAAHHKAKSIARRRTFWPERLPQLWLDDLREQAMGGVRRAVDLIRSGDVK